MDQRDFTKLTSALYRVTEMFPEQEPLRFGLRDWALKILTGLAPYHFSNGTNIDLETAKTNLKNIQTLRSLIEVSQGQKWVNEINLILLDQEYSRLEEQLSNIVEREEDDSKTEESVKLEKQIAVEKTSEPRVRSVLMKENKTYDLESKRSEELNGSTASSERQDQILRMIRQQPRIQMKQIQEQLTEVTARTLRRDLEGLVQQKKINRIGRGTGTFYQINLGITSE
jgi:hypothetical protein